MSVTTTQMGDRHDRARLCARPQISAETNSVQTTTGVPRESCSPCQSLVDYANTKITQHAAKNKQTKKRVKRSEPARVRRIASLVCCHLRHRVRHPLRRSSPVPHCRPTYRLLPRLRRPLHRAGFLVRHCCPTDRLLSLLQRLLHRSVSPFRRTR